MKFRSLSNLEKVLNRRFEMAMEDARREALEIMYHEVYSFYTNGKKPKRYVRTGALGDTVSATQLSKFGDAISFQAYLDKTHQYTTGKFNMPEVLLAAESRVRKKTRLVGKPGFWDRSLKKFDKLLERSLKKYIRLKNT